MTQHEGGGADGGEGVGDGFAGDVGGGTVHTRGVWSAWRNEERG